MKILIVDDEEYARNAIATCIDWKTIGINEVYQAENGEAALEIMKKQNIDIVLTDIVMPFMDGIELARELYHNYPRTKIIIISGYDEFEYAKQSIDFGVISYILKPVGANTLKSKIEEICNEIKKERRKEDYIKKMKTLVYQSLPLMQEKLLREVLTDSNKIDIRYLEKCQSFELSLEADRFVVALIYICFNDELLKQDELYRFAVKNIVSESVGKEHYVIDNGKYIVILYRFFDRDITKNKSYLISNLNHIQSLVKEILSLTLTCSIGEIVTKSKEITSSYKEAERAIECRYSLGENNIYDVNDLGYLKKAFYYPKDELDKYVKCVKNMGEEEIKASIETICSKIISQKLLISNIKIVFIEITTALLKELDGVSLEDKSIWNYGFQVFNRIEEMNDLESIKEEVLNFSLKVHKEFSLIQAGNNYKLISEAKEYMEKHYMDPQLSLTLIANHLAVSSGYLSALFKKETGTNYIKYLTNLRLDKAIDLILNTDMKSYEIAEAVGFSNSHYFSKTFKKKTGYSPMSYRSKMKSG